MIEVRNLTKRYGDKAAVDDLSFVVRPGLVTGFLGTNGSGKTVMIGPPFVLLVVLAIIPSDTAHRVLGYLPMIHVGDAPFLPVDTTVTASLLVFVAWIAVAYAVAVPLLYRRAA